MDVYVSPCKPKIKGNFQRIVCLKQDNPGLAFEHCEYQTDVYSLDVERKSKDINLILIVKGLAILSSTE